MSSRSPEALTCRGCHRPLTFGETPLRRIAATRYEDCLRKCNSCEIGYSNGLKNPTAIYKDPLKNLPKEVQRGVKQAVASALNETAKPQKLTRMGFDTSEDAVTWAVFSHLAYERPDVLAAIGESVFRLDQAGAPAVLLWGAPVSDGAAGAAARGRLIEISNKLGERPDRRSEPDVVLDYGTAGLVVIEVKLYSPNDVLSPDRCKQKFPRYVGKSGSFTDAQRTIETGLYELTRNWRFGWELAEDRPFRLVNLAPPELFHSAPRLDAFRACLSSSASRSFECITWPRFLAELSAVMGGLPDWLSDWLAARPRPIVRADW